MALVPHISDFSCSTSTDVIFERFTLVVESQGVCKDALRPRNFRSGTELDKRRSLAYRQANQITKGYSSTVFIAATTVSEQQHILFRALYGMGQCDLKSTKYTALSVYADKGKLSICIVFS